MAYCQDEGDVRALAGFKFLEFLACGKVLYIDDLITDSETRRSCHGEKLLKWVIEQGGKAKCDQIHLDSVPQRHDAHRLYFNHWFKIITYHLTLNFKEHLKEGN